MLCKSEGFSSFNITRIVYKPPRIEKKIFNFLQIIEQMQPCENIYRLLKFSKFRTLFFCITLLYNILMLLTLRLLMKETKYYIFMYFKINLET